MLILYYQITLSSFAAAHFFPFLLHPLLYTSTRSPSSIFKRVYNTKPYSFACAIFILLVLPISRPPLSLKLPQQRTYAILPVSLSKGGISPEPNAQPAKSKNEKKPRRLNNAKRGVTFFLFLASLIFAFGFLFLKSPYLFALCVSCFVLLAFPFACLLVVCLNMFLVLSLECSSCLCLCFFNSIFLCCLLYLLLINNILLFLLVSHLAST